MSEQLDIISAKIQVIQHVRPKCLIETAKACGVEPYAYLKEVFARLPS